MNDYSCHGLHDHQLPLREEHPSRELSRNRSGAKSLLGVLKRGA